MRHKESGLQQENGYVDSCVLVREDCHTLCIAPAPRHASFSAVKKRRGASLLDSCFKYSRNTRRNRTAVRLDVGEFCFQRRGFQRLFGPTARATNFSGSRRIEVLRRQEGENRCQPSDPR